MKSKDVLILLLIAAIITMFVIDSGMSEISEITIKTLESENVMLMTKQKQSELKLKAKDLQLKKSDEKIQSIQTNTQIKQIIYHEKIDSVRTFTKSEAYRFLTSRYFGNNP